MLALVLTIVVLLTIVTGWVLVNRRARATTDPVSLDAAPSAPIAHPPSEGPARFDGVAEAVDAPGEAPVSGRPALGWVVEVEILDVRRPTTRRREDGVAFVVADGTGRALVPPGDRTLVVSCDHETDPIPVPEAPEWVTEFLRIRGLPTASAKVRLREGIIPPGAEVAVVGIMEPGDPSSRAMGAEAILSGGRAGAMLVGTPRR